MLPSRGFDEARVYWNRIISVQYVYYLFLI